MADKKNRRRGILIAAASLAASATFALAAREFYRLQWFPAAQAAGALALLAGAAVLLLTAPHVLRWNRLQRFGWFRRSGVTREGLVFLVAVFAMAIAAISSRNNLLYLVLSSMFAAILVSGLVSRLGLSNLQMRLALPDHVFAETPFLAKIRIRNLKLWMPSFSVWIDPDVDGALRLPEAYCPQIAPRFEVAVTLEARFDDRGRYPDECLWLRTKFPFSFIERRIRLRLPHEITVYPSVQPDPAALEILKSMRQRRERLAAGDSHDIYRVRPFQPGESARFIHWKASARHRNLWVREFTREDHWRVEIEFDRRSAGGQKTQFEAAVNRVAAIVWQLHTQGAEVRFQSGDFQLNCPAVSTRIYEILRFLALTTPLPLDEPIRRPATRRTDSSERLSIGVDPRESIPA